ncbi:hypothetical protein [Thermocatellispora tengchongensis]|uniref:hypothetical protein n=1 Tax=Thermocatellispora tengchongensis TaxID=1073253 RepID=UPI0036288BD6
MDGSEHLEVRPAHAGRWRWRYVGPAADGGRAVRLSNTDYHSAEEARRGARAAYPEVPFAQTGDGGPPSLAARARHGLRRLVVLGMLGLLFYHLLRRALGGTSSGRTEAPGRRVESGGPVPA